jgi:hypothetical protein
MLVAQEPMTVDNLLKVVGVYNESDVSYHCEVPGIVTAVEERLNCKQLHKKSDSLLRDMMYFHMSESDRVNFLNFPKPKLRIELAENLPSELKTWIKNKYAPAYVAFMISQVKRQDSKDWRQQFTQEEKDKVWYWWSGAVSHSPSHQFKELWMITLQQGVNCLAKSKEYQQCNELTSIYAMRELYDKNLGRYIPTGASWCVELLKGWKTNVSLHQLSENPITPRGTFTYRDKVICIHADRKNRKYSEYG